MVLKAWKLILAKILAATAACTYVPFDAPRTPSKAFEPSGTDAALISRDLVAGTGQNAAFAALPDGNDALGARLRLIEQAQASIDIKTFLIKPDLAGGLVWLALYDAAERGVRIRLLFDDVFTTARDAEIATLDAHPNVEIRVFNPLSRNSLSFVSYALDFNRVNRRMHSKAFITDGALAIIGGRNIADEYYQIATAHEFADFDLFVGGPAVRSLSDAFDLYWNDKWSVPISALEEGDDSGLRQVLRDFRAPEFSEAAHVYDRAIGSNYIADLASGKIPPIYGRVDVTVDPPEKLRNPPDVGPFPVAEELYETLQSARREVFLVTPYFVPENYGATIFENLVKRGIRVRIYTNSLASTNHPYIHGYYAPYRKRLLAAGVEFYEVRADAPSFVDQVDAGVTLHSKVAIVDRTTIFTGSPNIDPRSLRQNSEIGLVIDSARLANEIQSRMEAAAPGYTFRVSLTPAGKPVWRYHGGAQPQEFQHEPGASGWRKFVSEIASWIGIESQV